MEIASVSIVASHGFEVAGLSILATRWRDALAAAGVPATVALPRVRQSHPDERRAQHEFADVADEIWRWRRSSGARDRLLLVGLPATDPDRILDAVAGDIERVTILWERPQQEVLAIAESLVGVPAGLRIATLSQSFVSDLCERLPSQRISVIPPALPRAAFGQKVLPPAGYALSIGRLTARKGADRLARTWADDVGPKLRVQLKLFGSGHGVADSVEDEVATIAARSPWIALNRLGSFAERFEVMRRANCAMFAARDDHLPQALLESMAAASVPIVTPIPGHLEAVDDDVDGLVLNGFDLSDLAERVEAILDCTVRSALANAAARRAQAYSPLRVASVILNAIR